MESNGCQYNGGYEFEPQVDLRSARRCFSRVGLACVSFFLVPLFLQLGLMAAARLAGAQLGESFWILVEMAIMYLVAFPLTVVIMRTLPAKTVERRFAMSPLRFFGIFVICVGGMFVGNIMGQMLMMFVSLLTGHPMVNDIQETLVQMNLWSVLIGIVIAAPVVEEIIFRKLLMDRIMPYGQLTAVLMSGTMFGLAHGNFYQFFYAFAIGLVFAYVYLRTGKVRYTIALHMMVNFLGGLVPMAILRLSEINPLLTAMLSAGEIVFMLGCVGCALILLIVFRKDIWFEKSRAFVSTGQRLAVIFGNTGMILFLSYCLISFVLQ